MKKPSRILALLCFFIIKLPTSFLDKVFGLVSFSTFGLRKKGPNQTMTYHVISFKSGSQCQKYWAIPTELSTILSSVYFHINELMNFQIISGWCVVISGQRWNPITKGRGEGEDIAMPGLAMILVVIKSVKRKSQGHLTPFGSILELLRPSRTSQFLLCS